MEDEEAAHFEPPIASLLQKARQSIIEYDHELLAVPLLTAVPDSARMAITSKKLLQESKSFVGFIGPPGAGKSSLCNTLVYCQQGAVLPKIYFEPSNSDETFTKGLWILSPTAKRLFSKDSDWEVFDMEGFQYRSESCWKQAMVLSVLAEIVVFCNRNPRCDALYEAAEVFAKGMHLCKKLAMSPVTRHVFVQVGEMVQTTPSRLGPVIDKIRHILQGSVTMITPFSIPEIRNVPERVLPFHRHIVHAVKRQLFPKLVFSKDSQAAAAKVAQLNILLDAFNRRHFSKCEKLGVQFFKIDCGRVYEQALAQHRERHSRLAASKEITSVETSFEEFLGPVDWPLKLHFETSPFFVEKYASAIEEWYPVQTRFEELTQVYRAQYESKMTALKAKLETEQLEAVAAEARRKAEEARQLADREEEAIRRRAEKAARLAAEIQRETERKRREYLIEQRLIAREAEMYRLTAEKATRDALVAQKRAAEEAAAVNAISRRKLEEIETVKSCQETEAEESRLMADEADRLAREAEIAETNATFRKLVYAATEAAKMAFSRHVSQVEDVYRPIYNESHFKRWQAYIDARPVDAFAREKGISIEAAADWTPFAMFYESEKALLRDKWRRQIELAKWKSPVKAMGTLKCKGGHNVVDEIFCLNCGDGKLFWADGPHRVAICQDCNFIKTVEDSLICTNCKQGAYCIIRPSEYVP